jgi:hypothetical protein
MSLRRTTRRLFWGGSSLRPFETASVNGIREALGEQARALLDSQLAQSEFVQHWDDQRMTVFSYDPKQHIRDLFPNRDIEAQIGRAMVRDAANKFLKCDMVLSQGRLYALQFSQKTKDFDLKDRFSIDRVQIFKDPMTPGDSAKAAAAPSSFDVQGIIDPGEATDLLPPAATEERERFREWIGTPLPSDYWVLLERTNGFLLNSGVKFCGTHASRQPGPTGNWIILAEKTGVALAAAEGSSTQQLVLLDRISHKFVAVDGSFAAGLKLLQQKASPS